MPQKRSPKRGPKDAPLQRAEPRWRGSEQCYTFSFEQRIGGPSVPLYEYKCLKCGRHTEKIENVSGPHLKKCPHCGGKVEPVITAPAIQFKGAGWYVTDYGGKKAADGDKADKPTAETKEAASKEKESETKETPAKESSSKEGKDKKPAKKSKSSEGTDG
jgi:putative FmdB family regulatory protein